MLLLSPPKPFTVDSRVKLYDRDGNLKRIMTVERFRKKFGKPGLFVNDAKPRGLRPLQRPQWAERVYGVLSRTPQVKREIAAATGLTKPQIGVGLKILLQAGRALAIGTSADRRFTRAA